MVICILNTISITIMGLWGKIWPILIAILFFGFIIFIHELGHFITAKLSKVRVNEFSLGMGPTLFKFQKSETVYSLRLFPIGGFVSMEGEDEDSPDENSFNNKSIGKRMIIILAGIAMNLLLGFILLIIILSMSPYIVSTTVSGFYDDAVSQNSGLQVNDQIQSINGMKIFTPYDITTSMIRDNDGVMEFVVKRDGKNITLPDVNFKTVNQEGHTITIHDFTCYAKEKNILTVISESWKMLLSMGRIVWLSLYDILAGTYGLNDLSGPIGTVAIVGESASSGFQSLYGFIDMLMLMAFITINVGLFNLLPIPALDGGRFLFLLIELIRRKPMNKKYESAINLVGLLLMFGLIALVTFSDILKLLKG